MPVVLGQRYGRLTALYASDRRIKHVSASGHQQTHRMTWCRCDCGQMVEVRNGSLAIGHVRSCGCLQRDWVLAYNTEHGQSDTPEHELWMRIQQRCGNPKNPDYARYGGRGIVMCEKWRQSFAAFLCDVGKRPSARHSLDRINNDRDYEPGNVRWATQREQVNNSTRIRPVTVRGETASMAEWGRRTGMSQDAIRARLDRGWTPERVVSTPRIHQRRRMVTFKEQQVPLTDLARTHGVCPNAVATRLKHGWPIERALSTPFRVYRKRRSTGAASRA